MPKLNSRLLQPQVTKFKESSYPQRLRGRGLLFGTFYCLIMDLYAQRNDPGLR